MPKTCNVSWDAIFEPIFKYCAFVCAPPLLRLNVVLGGGQKI